MKKLLFLITALLAGSVVMAQGSKEGVINRKSIIAFHTGPTIPLGDFKSHHIPDQGFSNIGGFAKTGYLFNLSYGYQFYPNFGVTSDLFYGRYNLDKTAIQNHAGLGINADHWQMIGFTVGPMATLDIAKGVKADLRIMGGVSNTNSPEIRSDGMVYFSGDWEWAPLFKGGLDVRIDLGNSAYFVLNGDYQYMKPIFTMATGDGLYAEEVKINLPAINITGGFGIKF